MLSLPAISAEHSEMKMSDMHSSASSQEYMAGMKNMHEKMMAAVNESNPDKAFAKGMIAHHEGQSQWLRPSSNTEKIRNEKACAGHH